MIIAFCDAFNEWMKSERKQPPPCSTCAKVKSMLSRADDMEAQVARTRKMARKTMNDHPGGVPDGES